MAVTNFVTKIFCADRKKYQGKRKNYLADNKNCQADSFHALCK